MEDNAAGSRPDWIAEEHAEIAEVYDWLAANGVDEWIPEHPEFTVAAGQLTYTSWQWRGPRGWDHEHFDPDPARTTRTVPLVVAPTDRIRELMPITGATLVEQP